MDYKDFGSRIRSVRRHQSLTQETLAERVGISASFLGHIERGTRVASLETLVALCNELNVAPEYLLRASLTGYNQYMPEGLSDQTKTKLRELLRLAQETVTNWDE
ncbi:MAG: helix-turn-helix transcriptional regulator [Christensenellaceae bacterium]|nr:helix-turn-helix transcriptional regulator [Christensenellaceae bacterium]